MTSAIGSIRGGASLKPGEALTLAANGRRVLWVCGDTDFTRALDQFRDVKVWPPGFRIYPNAGLIACQMAGSIRIMTATEYERGDAKGVTYHISNLAQADHHRIAPPIHFTKGGQHAA